MTVITKTNERDERKQTSDALTALEASVATNTSDIATNASAISALDGRITALEGGVDGSPPTSLKGRQTTNAGLIGFIEGYDNYAIATASASTNGQWVTVISETASGVIQYLTLYQTANAANLDAGARLSIDGTVVWSSDNNMWAASGDNNSGVALVGGESASDYGTFMAVPFTSSFSLEVRKNEATAGTVTFAAQYAYHLT